MDISLKRKIKLKEQSRKIVQEILNFGVTEEQKIDILFGLALTIESNKTMKSITSELKNHKKDINNDIEEDNSKKDRVLLT